MKQFEMVRKYFTEYSTISELYLDGRFICNILEDKDRGLDNSWDLEKIKLAKVSDRTAIPTGLYKIEWTYSNRFQRAMPELKGVKGFAGIRIHAGNTPDATSGCLIPGIKKGDDNVFDSRTNTMKLYNIIKIAIDNKEQVFINIKRK